ncbi:hypothetical protein ISCGN_006811 [Ixodes scapularis]
MSDVRFVGEYRLTKGVTRWLCEQLRGKLQPFLEGPRVLTVEQQVLAALRFYAAGGFQGTAGSDENIVDENTVDGSEPEVLSQLLRTSGWTSLPTRRDMATLRLLATIIGPGIPQGFLMDHQEGLMDHQESLMDHQPILDAPSDCPDGPLDFFDGPSGFLMDHQKGLMDHQEGLMDHQEVVSCALLPRQPHSSSWSVFEVLDISVGFTRFGENGEISDVHRALFKNCNPSNVVDFERRTAYKVSWDGDANARGGYYDAEILELTGLCILQRAAIGLSSHLDNFSVAVPS